MNATDDTIAVLHVDDEPGFAEMAGEFLEREGPFRVETATSADEALDRLGDDGFDCVVSDYDMPDRDGLSLLRAVRERRGDLPFVLFTGKGSEEVASEAISAGVSDYLQKGTGTEQYTILANRLQNLVERCRAEANYRETFENAADGIIVHDAETGEMIDANERVAEMLGYDREELLSMSIGEFSADGFTDERAAERLRHAVEEGEQTFEWRNERADGTEQWSEIHLATTVLDGQECVLASVRDISERKAREREQRETNRQLQGVLDTVSAAIFVKDPDGHYLLMNERTRELAGLDDGTEVAGVTDDELFPEEVAERFQADDRRVIESGETIEIEEEVPAGEDTETMLTKKSPVYDEDGDLYAVCAVATEITDRKQRERELDFFRRLVESVGVGVGVYGADGRFSYVNAEYAALFDADPARLEGMAVWEVNPEFEREYFQDYWDSFEEGETRYSETRHVVDGDEVPVETVTTRRTIQGTAYNFGTIQDVTDRKARERELEASNERLDQFASLVSHDLRNPLNVATGSLELAREECDSERLATVAREHRRMESLIDDLLTLARQGTAPTDTERVDLAQAVERCWRSVRTSDAELVVETDATVLAETGQLTQLLENLLWNAVEHGSTNPSSQAPADAVEPCSTSSRPETGDAVTNGSTEPEPQTGADGAGERRARTDDAGGPAMTVTVGDTAEGFYVADDGPGIPDGERERVFESGYSTRVDGTGFGLTIVQQVADAHGWSVSIAESADGGARFDISGVERP